MTNTRKTISVILALCLLLSVELTLWSCNSNRGTGNGTDSNTGAHETEYFELFDNAGQCKYKVVRPEKTGQTVIDAAVRLRCGLDDATGDTSSVGIQDDWIMRGTTLDESANEILIGNTNRPESAALRSRLNGLSFGIVITDTKVVINGTNDVMISRAVDYFLEKYVAGSEARVGASSLMLPRPLDYLSQPMQSLTFTEADGTSKCIVIYPSVDDGTCHTLATVICDEIEKYSGTRPLAVSEDKAVNTDTCRIIVGNTSTDESKRVYANLNTADWAAKQDGNCFVLAGWSALTLSRSVDAFLLYLPTVMLEKNSDGKAGLYLPQGVDLSSGFDGWVDVNVPRPEGLFYTADADDNAYSMTAFADSPDIYYSYIASLRSSGFTEYVTNTIGNSYFATYSRDDAVVNASYNPASGSLCVVVEPMDNTALPAKEAAPYTKTCDVLLTQVGLTYGAVDCGMSYVIRLCDGKFIIIDGGWDEEGEQSKLYNLLLSQSGNKEPVIAAWIFTHAHKDHIGCYSGFSTTYGKKVTLESVIYSFPCYDQLVTSSSTNLESYIEGFPDYAAAFKGNPTIYRARTGQKYYFSGAVIEILLSFDDIAPKTLTYFNDSSLAFSVDVAGQRIMFLGDASQPNNNMISKRYGSYLKSDFVQVAHHGYSGGTTSVYDAIDPAWVLFPTPAFRYEVFKDDTVSGYLLKSLHVKKCFVSGLGTDTLTLPYNG